MSLLGSYRREIESIKQKRKQIKQRRFIGVTDIDDWFNTEPSSNSIARLMKQSVREHRMTLFIALLARIDDAELLKELCFVCVENNKLDKLQLLIAIRGHTPDLDDLLISAAGQEKIEMVKYLIGLADINASNETGSVLSNACFTGNIRLVRYLIDMKVRINDRFVLLEQRNMTALHQCCITHDKDLVNLLVSRGAHINVVDEQGETSLFLASKNGDEDIVKLLLSQNGNPNIYNLERQGPLIVAVKEDNPKIVKLLLNYGANPHHVDIYNKKARDYLTDQSNSNIETYLKSYERR